MRVDIYSSLKLEPNNKVMIGDKKLTAQEAFRIFISFLKEYKYYGVFLSNMRWYYGIHYQMFPTHFMIWSLSMTAMQSRFYRYHWYLDYALLFPFSKKKEFIPSNEVIELMQFWNEYCKENNLLYSIIKEQNPTINTDQRGYTTYKILEECDYPVNNKYYTYFNDEWLDYL